MNAWLTYYLPKNYFVMEFMYIDIDLSISFTLGLFRQNEGPKKLERKSILKMLKYLEIVENLPKKTECRNYCG